MFKIFDYVRRSLPKQLPSKANISYLLMGLGCALFFYTLLTATIQPPKSIHGQSRFGYIKPSEK